ncbi:hypothetical protein C8J57DRAFT_1091364 [Mycena rebaudengoi]|nr:hypothetical protein C8J57DRAFT_1091364 [Mycena rebaudengoi]
MFLLGQLESGVYMDDCDGVHPGVIAELYGVHGAVLQRAPRETGAGQFDDEEIPQINPNGLDLDEDDWEDMIDNIDAAHAHNFHHEPVTVPKHQNPFPEDILQMFDTMLTESERLKIVPPGYGLLPDEWENGSYPAYEILKSGRKGSKELRVALPDSIWRPRAEQWGRALAILDHITYLLKDSDNG